MKFSSKLTGDLVGGIFAALGFIASVPVHAQFITLANGNGNQSSMMAIAYGASQTTEVNSIPDSDSANAEGQDNSGARSVSQVIGDFSGTYLNTQFSQDATAGAIPGIVVASSSSVPFYSMFGETELFFTANSESSFAIAGSSTIPGAFFSETLTANLSDLTTNADIVSVTGSSPISVNGLLNAGDIYEWDVSSLLISSPFLKGGLAGTVNITFGAVPESSTWALLLGGLGLLTFWKSCARSCWWRTRRG